PGPPRVLLSFPTRRSSDLVLGLLGGAPKRPDSGVLMTAAGLYAALLVLTIGGERAYRSTLSGGASTTVAEKGAGHAHDPKGDARSEEHTSELQSRRDLVCR